MIRKNSRYIPLILLLLCGFANMHGQFVINGVVSDKEHQPIPFATILLQGTKSGTITNSNGEFNISTIQYVDSLVVSAVGYYKNTLHLRNIKQQHLNIVLKDNIYELSEIRVKPGQNPAHPILKKIIANKAVNNPQNFESYQSSVYNKVELDLKNITKPKKERRLWRQVGFVFENIDSTELQGVPFLPVFMTETFSDFYRSSKNNKSREVIRANRISGVKSATLTRFTGKFYQDFNVYENYINVENIGLISPINDQALFFYKYILIDSTYSDGFKLYQIEFRPRMSQDPAFFGVMWVVDSLFCIQKIDLKISEQVNINFLNDLQISKQFTSQDDRFVPEKELIYADFDIEGNQKNRTVGVIGRKTTIYESFVFGEPPLDVMDVPMQTRVLDDAVGKSANFWTENRPEKLNLREEGIYQMVDSLQNLPVFERATSFFETLFFGYKKFGKVELGPYYYMYSYNPIEGNRWRLGGRTTKEFNTNIRLDGYGAYGIKDREFKYNVGGSYYFNKEPYRAASIHYTHDYQLLGKSKNAFSEDNFLNAAVSLSPNNKLTMTDNLTVDYTHEWFTGLANKLSAQFQKIQAGPFIPFIKPDGTSVNYISNSEIGLNTRIAINEAHIPGDFEPLTLGSKKPIINIYAGMGRVTINTQSDSYGKLSVDIYDKIPLNPIGYTQVYLQGGILFGSVPFPILKLHEGNETITNDLYAYNLMNYYEFASDRYASLFLEHHWQGFFLNKIPLFKRLKWREVIGTKVLWGSLNPNNHDQLQFTPELTGLNDEPYVETSAGLENIFRFFRVDAIWRLSHRNHSQNSPLFGVRMSFQVRF